MKITAKLVTVHRPHSTMNPSTKRKAKRARIPQQEVDHVIYRESFNTINYTLTKHGTLSITLKQSNPTILTVNRPHFTLLNTIL